MYICDSVFIYIYSHEAEFRMRPVNRVVRKLNTARPLRLSRPFIERSDGEKGGSRDPSFVVARVKSC